jgi:hypothetical protein
MSEFERARERAERKAAKRGAVIDSDTPESLDEAFEKLQQIANDEPAKEPKAPKKRSNEIAVQVWIDGNEYCFTFKTNITGSFLGTQQSRQGMQQVILEALRAKFGAVEQV